MRGGPGKMTQRELITHFINGLRFRWNTAVSAAPLGTQPAYVSPDPAHIRTSTYSSQHTHSHTHKSTLRTHTRSSFFFSCLVLSPFLSFCHCFISQPGECLNVIMTFVIKSKQRGGIEESMPDLPFFPRWECRSMSSAILIVSAPFQQMDRRF